MGCKKGTIRGCESGSVPYMCYELLKKENKIMGSGKIFLSFDPALGIKRLTVASALHHLEKIGVIHKTGNSKSMLYGLSGKPLPIRVKNSTKWKERKPTLSGNPPIIKSPLTKPNINTINIYRYNEKISVPSPITEKHHRVEAPIRINCNSCEWYGPEPKCKHCTYEFPHRSEAA